MSYGTISTTYPAPPTLIPPSGETTELHCDSRPSLTISAHRFKESWNWVPHGANPPESPVISPILRVSGSSITSGASSAAGSGAAGSVSSAPDGAAVCTGSAGTSVASSSPPHAATMSIAATTGAKRRTAQGNALRRTRGRLRPTSRTTPILAIPLLPPFAGTDRTGQSTI